MATPRGIREAVERVTRTSTGTSAPTRSISAAIARPPAQTMASAISDAITATTGSSAPAVTAARPAPAQVPAAQAVITIPSGETGQVLPSGSRSDPFNLGAGFYGGKYYSSYAEAKRAGALYPTKVPVIDPMKEPSPYLPFEQRFKVSPVETAPTSTDAILSASAGGDVMMQEPARQAYAPGLPQIPSSETAVMDQAMAGKEVTLAKPSGGGGAMAVGAVAGFFVAGPIGALIAAVIAGSMAKPKPTPVSGFDGFSFKRAFRGVKKAFSSPKEAFKTIGKGIAAPLIVPTAILTKGTTYLGAKTGLKPLKKADVAVGKAYRSDVMKSTRDIYAAELVLGAAVGAGIAAAPYVASAAGKLTATSVLGAASTASKVLKGEASPGGLEQIESDLAQQAAERQAAETASAGGGKSGLGLAAAGAGAGFLVGGPPGAIVGAVAGMILGRR